MKRSVIVSVFVLCGAGLVMPAGAQLPAHPGPLPLGEGFAEVSGWVIKAAEAVPADKYSYRPVETVRTFGQQVAHIADAYGWYCARATGRDVEWSEAIEKGPNDKATLIAKLKAATETCAAVYRGASQTPPMVGVIAHTNLHYGNLITYMRMLGLKPPSS